MTPQDPVAHLARVILLPLAALGLGPVLLLEWHLSSQHDLVASAIPDVLFFEHAARGLLAGHVPYLNHFLTPPFGRFVFVYPPLTLLLTLPALLAGSHYEVGFAAEVLALLVLGLWLLQTALRRGGGTFPIALVVAVLLLSLGPLLVTRVDALQGLIVAGAALALRNRRITTAVVLVTLAVLVKETVVMALLPVLGWALWPSPGAGLTEGIGARARAVGWGLVPAALLVLGFSVWSRGEVFAAALASIHRGVEIESIPATLSYLTRPWFGLSTHAGDLGSVEIAGPQVAALAAVVALLGVVALGWGTLHFLRERRRPATAVAFAVAVGLAATPVLSPQYLLALVPVLVLAAVTEFEPGRGRLLLGGCLLAGLLTQLEFPYLFNSVDSLAPLGMATLALRNLILVALTVVLAGAAPIPAPVPTSAEEPLLVTSRAG
ncbi:MAG: glycosyltransferase 87 family protein [Candidatus Dormibacteria bacterium]